jgi:hypothetical protein
MLFDYLFIKSHLKIFVYVKSWFKTCLGIITIKDFPPNRFVWNLLWLLDYRHWSFATQFYTGCRKWRIWFICKHILPVNTTNTPGSDLEHMGPGGEGRLSRSTDLPIFFIVYFIYTSTQTKKLPLLPFSWAKQHKD